MKTRVRVVQVGWGRDMQNKRHARIEIARREWTAVLYEDPAKGWQVVTLAVAPRSTRDTRPEKYGGAFAGRKLADLLGGELRLTNGSLGALVEDLYETGQRGAEARWVGKLIVLDVDKSR